MKTLATPWQFWAVLLARFAALTAIFAKVGIEHLGSDFATFIRTSVILLILGAILYRHPGVAVLRLRVSAQPRARDSTAARGRSMTPVREEDDAGTGRDDHEGGGRGA
jgi:hypothetical protein